MRDASRPTVKQELAAIRRLFDWLTVRQVVPGSPAAAVRGPKHSVRRGKTPVLATAECRRFLRGTPTDTFGDLRDRTLVAVMTYSIVRISAVLAMNVKDVFRMEDRLWLRQYEKGGKKLDISLPPQPGIVSLGLCGGSRDPRRPRGSPLPPAQPRRLAIGAPLQRAQRLGDARATRPERRDHDARLQSLVPGDGHYRLPREPGGAGRGGPVPSAWRS